MEVQTHLLKVLVFVPAGRKEGCCLVREGRVAAATEDFQRGEGMGDQMWKEADRCKLLIDFSQVSRASSLAKSGEQQSSSGGKNLGR